MEEVGGVYGVEDGVAGSPDPGSSTSATTTASEVDKSVENTRFLLLFSLFGRRIFVLWWRPQNAL